MTPVKEETRELPAPAFRKTKIGLLPNDWECVPFGDVAVREKTPVDVRQSAEYREIGVRSHGRGVFHKPMTTGESLGDKRVFHVHPGTLVFNIVFAWEQAVAVLSDSESGMIASHRFPMYSGRNETVDVSFLHRYFLTARGKHELELASPGGAGRNKTLGQGGLSRLPVPLPPLPEQERIVEILSTWDSAIADVEALIAARRTRKTGLMQQLLTGDTRLPELSGKWGDVSLGEVCERVVRRNTTGETRALTVSGNDGLVSQERFFTKRIAPEDTGKYYLLKRGEFAYNRSSCAGYPMGAIKRLDRYESGVLSTLYICFAVNSKKVSGYFLAQYLASSHLNRQLYGIVQEGARNHGLLNVNVSDFFGLRVVLPPLPEQRALADLLGTADEEIRALEEKREALEAQKRGLLQQLMIGELRVPMNGKGD